MYLLKRFAGYDESEAYDAKKHVWAPRLYGSASAELADRRLFRHTARAESGDAPDLLRAFEAALGEALGELTEWLIGQPAPEPTV